MGCVAQQTNRVDAIIVAELLVVVQVLRDQEARVADQVQALLLDHPAIVLDRPRRHHHVTDRERRIEPARDESPSIAVLPFANMSPDPEQEYFCEGIAEEIINALTRLENVRVASRTSAFQFKGRSQDMRKVGEGLNVTTVLEGSVRRAGQRLRVSIASALSPAEQIETSVSPTQSPSPAVRTSASFSPKAAVWLSMTS